MASKNRKNKVSFKWTKELIILISAIVVLIVATIILSIPSSNERTVTKFNTAIQTYNTANSTSYSQIALDSNVIVEISHDDLFKKVNSSNDYIYVIYGSTNNGTVLEQLANINSTAKDAEIKTVYFYSSQWVEETENTDTETFQTKASLLENDFNASVDQDQDDFDLLKYPSFLVFKDKTLVFNSQTYADVDAYNWYMYVQKGLLLSK